jgi:hypothetical protein
MMLQLRYAQAASQLVTAERWSRAVRSGLDVCGYGVFFFPALCRSTDL